MSPWLPVLLPVLPLLPLSPLPLPLPFYGILHEGCWHQPQDFVLVCAAPGLWLNRRRRGAHVGFCCSSDPECPEVGLINHSSHDAGKVDRVGPTAAKDLELETVEHRRNYGATIGKHRGRRNHDMSHATVPVEPLWELLPLHTRAPPKHNVLRSGDTWVLAR